MTNVLQSCFGNLTGRKKKKSLDGMQRQNTEERLAQINSSKPFISFHSPNRLQQVAENIFEE